MPGKSNQQEVSLMKRLGHNSEYRCKGLLVDVYAGALVRCIVVAILLEEIAKWDIPLAYDGVHFTEQGHKTFTAELLEELK